MATTPTSNPIPSESPQDLKFNAGKIDEFVTSSGWTYTDRFGVKRYTIEGMNYLARQSLAAFGYITLDSFQAGATLTLPNQVLRDTSTGEYFRWDGLFPKTVPANSNPVNTGGVARGAWVSVGDAALRSNLMSEDENQGDKLVRVKQPFTGSISRTQHDKNADVINAADFATLQDAVNYIKSLPSNAGTINVNPGTIELSTPLDVRGVNLIIQGSGMLSTTLKATFTDTTKAVINADSSTDIRMSPLTIRDLTVNANGKAGFGIRHQHRHPVRLESLWVLNATDTNIWATNSWLASYDNCIIEESPVGVNWAGANHRSSMNSCSIQACSGYFMKVGDGQDGNSALQFNNCDFEFGVGNGIQWKGAIGSFNECYIGEGVDGNILDINGGRVNINGGIFYFGHNSLYGVIAREGNVHINGSTIAGQGGATLLKLVLQAGGGKIDIDDSIINVPLGGVNSFDGMPFGSKPIKTFAPTRGRSYTKNDSNTTTTLSPYSDRGVSLTCTAISSSTNAMSLSSTAIDKTWSINSPGLIIVTYSSTKELNLRLSTSNFGGVPTSLLATLPSTNGSNKTHVVADILMPYTEAGVLEFVMNPAAVGDNIKIIDVTITDRESTRVGSSDDLSRLFRAQ